MHCELGVIFYAGLKSISTTRVRAKEWKKKEREAGQGQAPVKQAIKAERRADGRLRARAA